MSGGASASSAPMPRLHRARAPAMPPTSDSRIVSTSVCRTGGAGRRRARSGWPSRAAAAAAGEQQVGQVHARHQQHEPDAAEQEQQRGTDAADRLLVQRDHVRADSAVRCREKRSASCRAMPETSACACATVTPGFSRPTAARKRASARERGHTRSPANPLARMPAAARHPPGMRA